MFNEKMSAREQAARKKKKKKLRGTCEQVSETRERLCESKISTGKGQIESSVDR